MIHSWLQRVGDFHTKIRAIEKLFGWDTADSITNRAILFLIQVIYQKRQLGKPYLHRIHAFNYMWAYTVFDLNIIFYETIFILVAYHTSPGQKLTEYTLKPPIFKGIEVFSIANLHFFKS